VIVKWHRKSVPYPVSSCAVTPGRVRTQAAKTTAATAATTASTAMTRARMPPVSLQRRPGKARLGPKSTGQLARPFRDSGLRRPPGVVGPGQQLVRVSRSPALGRGGDCRVPVDVQ
jgi:hypothetical protein